MYKLLGLESSLDSLLHLVIRYLPGYDKGSICAAYRAFLQDRYPALDIPKNTGVTLISGSADVEPYYRVGLAIPSPLVKPDWWISHIRLTYSMSP